MARCGMQHEAAWRALTSIAARSRGGAAQQAHWAHLVMYCMAMGVATAVIASKVCLCASVAQPKAYVAMSDLAGESIAVATSRTRRSTAMLQNHEPPW